jgi:cysteine desulfurase/selenocysteine lyase
MSGANDGDQLRSRFVGTEIEVPVLGGETVRYINFDNAASTPPLRSVRDGVSAFLDHYASVHRGTGFKSQLSTWAYEDARQTVLRFVGADPARHVCIFGKNTTEALNKLAKRLRFEPGDVVLTTEMEHHSDDLPYRGVAEVVHVGVLPDGRLDEDDFDRRLSSLRGRVRLVAVTGASNVTGYLNPVHRLAAKAHQAGAWIVVDAAQLAPHRTVRMGDLEDLEHFDFVSLSAHKLYAPFGTGALVGRRDVFESGDPDVRGGGTVEIVTVDDVVWAEPPDRDEAGSPNVVGAVALALAIRELEAIGMAKVASHEAELTALALRRLREIPGVRIFGDRRPETASERLGVIPFTVDGISHFLVAAILGYEFGVGVRSGCFCAHPYVLRLLGLSDEEASGVRALMAEHDRREMPGLVRMSFGLYNTADEVDRVIGAVAAIVRGDYRGTYHQDRASGDFIPEGWDPPFAAYYEAITNGSGKPVRVEP